MSNSPGNWDIYTTSIQGESGTNLTESNLTQDGLGIFSPDGSWVAFVSDRDGGWGIWVIPTNGGEAVRLPINIPYWHAEYGGWTNERISWGR